MVKSLVTGILTCVEYGIAVLFTVSFVFIFVWGLDSIVPSGHNKLAGQELLKAVKEGYESKQITSQQSAEILQFYRDDQTKSRRLRMYILYTVSICMSAAVMLLLFKKYRFLRFRERFRDYLFTPKRL